jgi:hypothetical protein
LPFSASVFVKLKSHSGTLMLACSRGRAARGFSEADRSFRGTRGAADHQQWRNVRGDPWRYKRELPDDLFQLHPTSRGVGLWQDRLYLATTDDHVVSLDAKTGKVVWDTKVQDYKKGQYLTLMPLVVVDGKVIVGGSGGEFGVRGYVVAYDASNGKELWRTFTIPGEGEPGNDTWKR